MNDKPSPYLIFKSWKLWIGIFAFSIIFVICSRSGDKDPFEFEKREVNKFCKELLTKKIAIKDSINFSYFESALGFVMSDGSEDPLKIRYRGTVEYKNAFGVNFNSKYSCVVSKKGSNWILEELLLDDKKLQ